MASKQLITRPNLRDEVSFLRLPELKSVTGLSKSSLYALIRAKSFPSPVQPGPRTVAWVRSEVRQWAVERILPECHVLFASIELIAPKPELGSCRQDEQTETASVEHLVLLGLRLSVFEFLDGQCHDEPPRWGNSHSPTFGSSYPKPFPNNIDGCPRTDSHLHGGLSLENSRV
jgi:prophage regulatory protein